LEGDEKSKFSISATTQPFNIGSRPSKRENLSGVGNARSAHLGDLDWEGEGRKRRPSPKGGQVFDGRPQAKRPRGETAYPSKKKSRRNTKRKIDSATVLGYAEISGGGRYLKTRPRVRDRVAIQKAACAVAAFKRKKRMKD